MRYFILLMALVLSSCSHDDSQVNNGWVIYENIFGKWKNRIKYDMFGMSCYAVFYSFEDAYEFNYGKNKEEKVKVVDSCYKKRW